VKRLGGVTAFLSAALRLACAQETRSEPSTVVWGSLSNTSLSLTVGVVQRRVLLVTGFAGTLGSRDRAAMLGGGVTLRSGATRTRVLLETLLGSGGWTGRVAVATASALGQGSMFGRVHLSHPLEPGADPPEAEGLVMLHGRLGRALGWGAAYDCAAKSGQVAQHHLGPSLEVGMPHGALIVAFGRGLGRSADQVSVWVRVGG
jgi:hypothetical protein